MNRLEDKFKDAFDHFEPEVDPGVWTKISAELPTSPASVTSGSTAVKGIAAKLGVKGIAALIAAAAISVSAVYYFSSRNNNHPAPEVTEQTIQRQESAPAPTIDVEATTAENTSSDNAGSTEQTSPAVPQQEVNHTPGTADQRIQHPAASTGTTAMAGGEVVQSQHSPAPAVNPIKSISQDMSASSPANPSTPVPVINNNPSPVLIVSSTTGFAPLTITVLTNQQGKNADFDFGDGSVSGHRFSATHTYEKAGDYTLQCVVDGISLSKTIHVAGSVPTAFSPNGDGINDLFEVENGDEIQLEIRIFTRSGRPVFTGKGTRISWDGMMPDGSRAEPGTYLYDIFANPDGAPAWKQKGSLHLFN